MTKTIDSDAVQAIGLTPAIDDSYPCRLFRQPVAPLLRLGAGGKKTQYHGILLYQMSRRARGSGDAGDQSAAR